jgi:hypothetical protein
MCIWTKRPVSTQAKVQARPVSTQAKVQAAVQSPNVNSDALLAYYYMLLSAFRGAKPSQL